MYGPSDLDGLTVVEGLELCELLRVALDEIRQLVNEPGPLEARHILAPGGLERLASGGNRDVDILLRS